MWRHHGCWLCSAGTSKHNVSLADQQTACLQQHSKFDSCALQANLTKQLAKLVKVKYVEDITDSTRVGECSWQHLAAPAALPQLQRQQGTRPGGVLKVAAEHDPPADAPSTLKAECPALRTVMPHAQP